MPRPRHSDQNSCVDFFPKLRKIDASTDLAGVSRVAQTPPIFRVFLGLGTFSSRPQIAQIIKDRRAERLAGIGPSHPGSSDIERMADRRRPQQKSRIFSRRSRMPGFSPPRGDNVRPRPPNQAGQRGPPRATSGGPDYGRGTPPTAENAIKPGGNSYLSPEE